MRRILLALVGVAVLALPAAATARAGRHSAQPGFLVVKNAFADEGVVGRPVATVVVRGFVLGRISQEGAVQLFRLAPSGGAPPQAAGLGVSAHRVTYRRAPGVEFTGSDFRFRGVSGANGVWRVVVYGSGVSLYAGYRGHATISLHGSATYPSDDGTYSINGGRFISLPAGVVTRTFGAP